MGLGRGGERGKEVIVKFDRVQQINHGDEGGGGGGNGGSEHLLAV